MRRGFSPKIFLTTKGEIFAIATGSDACAEHEGGSKLMQTELCTGASFTDDDTILTALRNNESVQYPQLIERKTLNRNLGAIQFVEGSVANGTPYAAIVFEHDRSASVSFPVTRELDIHGDSEYGGAWDEASFGFSVLGKKLVAKLKTFFNAIQAGDGLFAGTFLQGPEFLRTTGVILALRSHLRPEHQQLIKTAQLEFEQSLVLKARSRVSELHELVNAKSAPPHASLPGYIWPVWKDTVGGDVVYAVNPNYDVQKLVGYYGPYTFEALKDWTLAKVKYPLSSNVRKREPVIA